DVDGRSVLGVSPRPRRPRSMRPESVGLVVPCGLRPTCVGPDDGVTLPVPIGARPVLPIGARPPPPMGATLPPLIGARPPPVTGATPPTLIVPPRVPSTGRTPR